MIIRDLLIVYHICFTYFDIYIKNMQYIKSINTYIEQIQRVDWLIKMENRTSNIENAKKVED